MSNLHSHHVMVFYSSFVTLRTFYRFVAIFTAEPKSASVEVDITITDANDNPPGFFKIPPTILISELALPGTPVFTVIASDPDIGDNGKIL